MPIQTPICDFGQKAIPFELKSTDNKILSLNDIKGENGTGWSEPRRNHATEHVRGISRYAFVLVAGLL